VQALLDNLIRSLGHDPATWPLAQAVYAVAMLLVAVLVITFAAVTGGIFSWAERRVAARMQSRIGPNRAGPGGFLQWIADAVKLLFKEDLIPTEADAPLFRAAPYFMMVGFGCIFVALPFSHALIVADMNIGIFYILAVTALIVVGIIMSGWSSNSKWALFGAIRSAAQIVSYEIPSGMAALVPVLLAGTMSTQGIIRAQGAWPWQWYAFHDPFCFAAFVISFISALAEGNRTPFDLPEAESELVSGYNTEYSGMRFAYFFLVEWGNMWVMSALTTTLFFGGWQIPFVSAAQLDASTGGVGVALELLSLAIFVSKTLVFVFVVMWLRWTLPRIRVDQMMDLCWKYLVPVSIVGTLSVSVWMLITRAVPVLELIVQLGMTAMAAFLVVKFVARTFQNIKDTGDLVDLRSGWSTSVPPR
jgi:NADH-quinone oxidoreductase subunit H